MSTKVARAEPRALKMLGKSSHPERALLGLGFPRVPRE
jgi:hypothetical protein